MPGLNGYAGTLGALALTKSNRIVDGYALDLMARDADFSNPVPVTAVMESLMADGDLTRRTKDGNRVATFIVEIEGEDRDQLAIAGALLDNECNKPVNTFLWEGPTGEDFYLDVVDAHSDYMTDISHEVINNIRLYRLTLECLPYVRSTTEYQTLWTGGASSVTTTGSPNRSATYTAKRFLRIVTPAGASAPTTIKINTVAVAAGDIRTTGTAGLTALATHIDTRRFRRPVDHGHLLRQQPDLGVVTELPRPQRTRIDPGGHRHHRLARHSTVPGHHQLHRAGRGCVGLHRPQPGRRDPGLRRLRAALF